MTDQEFKDHVTDLLARLDTKMTALVGNGQPGRISQIEAQLEIVKKIAWSIGGGLLVITTVIHFVWK